MSFDVVLLDESAETIQLPRSHAEGGTYVMGGTNEASLNITYNYSSFYYENIDKDQGLRWLHEKKAMLTQDVLYNAVKILGIDRYTGEYWVWSADITIGRLLGKEPCKASSDFLESIGFYSNSIIRVEDLTPLELQKAKQLELVRDTGGYWKATPGNAGHALNILLNWALMFPNGCWSVQ